MSKKNKPPDSDESKDYEVISGSEIQKVLSGINSISKAIESITQTNLIVSKFTENLFAAITIPFDQILEKALLPYKQVTLPYNQFLEGFRKIQDINIRFSEFFEHLSETIFRPFNIISEIFRKNAEVIDSVFNRISGFQSFSESISLHIPTVTFDRKLENEAETIPSKVLEETESPEDVNGLLDTNKLAQFKPKFGFAEYRITIQGERDGQVRVFTHRQQLTDLKKVEAALPHLTEQRNLLPEFIQEELKGSNHPISNEPVYNREEREITIEQEQGKFIISVEGIGSSSPIENCNWLKMFTFFKKYRSVPIDAIVWKWNSLDKNHFKSKKTKKRDKGYIPQIIRQIYDGLSMCFPVAVPYLKIKRLKDDTYVTYKLIVHQNLPS